jgi:hypothetical protein
MEGATMAEQGETSILADPAVPPAPEIPPLFDWALQGLVRLVYQLDSTIAISLNVHGSLVTGDLCSPFRWAEAHDARFAKAAAFDTGESHVMADEIRQVYIDKEERQKRLGPEPFSYIHLLDARIFTGTFAMPELGHPGVPWRGMATSIDGWFLGKYQS